MSRGDDRGPGPPETTSNLPGSLADPGTKDSSYAGHSVYDLMVAIFFAGWLLLLVGFLITQMRFYDAHQHAHNLWRPRSTPWMLARSGAEYRAMIRATFRRDANPRVEERRRQYVAVLGLVAIYLLIGFPVAVIFLP